jgi:3-dehydroshikimate dehydratase
MFTISAFADEISPDPVEQVDLLAKCGVRYIELRSIHKTNVLALTDHQIRELKSLLDARGFGLSAIGSPIGKVKIDEEFEPHFKRFERAVELAQLFETANIRIFSFYPPGDAKDWNGVEARWEKEVFDRMHRLADRADQAGLRLVHENEHRIYGDAPDRVVKLFKAVPSPSLKAVYDAANYVFCGYDPWEGWTKTKALTAHFHIKDWKKGADHGSLPGEGEGRWPEVIADAKGYVGYATMEPHLLGGGPTGGVTGPELFPQAITAFRGIMATAGVKEG